MANVWGEGCQSVSLLSKEVFLKCCLLVCDVIDMGFPFSWKLGWPYSWLAWGLYSVFSMILNLVSFHDIKSIVFSF